MTTIRSALVAWQCLFTLIRLLSSVCATGFWAWRADGLRRILLRLSDTWTELRDVPRPLIAPFTCWLVLWVIIALNDIFMLAIDHKRTDTYLGCIAVQTGINCCYTFLIILHFALSRVYRAQARFFNDFMPGYANAYSYPVDAILGIFALLAGICSIFILAIEVSAIFTLRSSKPIVSVGKTNTKDALALRLSGPKTLSVLGNPRATIIPIYFPQPVVKLARVMKRILAHLLFNRVRSVETRIYALIRNLFALVSMVVLIFRTVAALQQARNEVQTRVISADCGLASSSHQISILVDRPYWDNPELEETTVAISAVTPSGGGINCTAGWSRKFFNEFYPPPYKNRILELFTCDEVFSFNINSWESEYYSIANPKFVYHVQVRPGAKTGITNDGQMPHIWLMNAKEIPDADHDRSWSDVSQVRAYQAPLDLLRGSHIVTETNLVTRRFIRSSVLKEILFSAKSDYRRLSLYPISILSTMTLNSTDKSIARATIRPTLAPGLRYHRTQANVQDSSLSPSKTCDFVDDYRVGTVFNALGSIGGLFALLQAIHLLLFGRPLLWSITGAKTVTPFGLLGGFSSRGFKQRLRAEYHEPGEDGADTIRIVPFLRDFVLDFGPADFNPERRPSRKSSISPLTLGRDSEDLDGTQIPLIQIDHDTGAEPPRDSDVEDTDRGNDRHSIRSVV